MMRSYFGFAWLVTISAWQVGFIAGQAQASVIPPKIADLVAQSQLIVLVKVDSVKDGRAKATVKEVWKGEKVDAVEYRINPSFACDISSAEVGETVLLFLTKEENGWGIAWVGRGRMPLETLDGKEYLSYFIDVVVPKGTPEVEFAGKARSGFRQGVELKVMKELVQKANPPQK